MKRNPDTYTDMASIGEDITRKLIEYGKIKPGMKVLDLGCGSGDISFLISGYVGTEGTVVGIDNNENAISNATNKLQESGLTNLSFYVKDLTQDFEFDNRDFDAIIVRRVLMYLPDVENVIKAAAQYLKTDGVFLAQENDISLTPIGLKSMPIHRKIIRLIRETLKKENVNFKMGFDLFSVLTNANLRVEKIWAEAALSTPTQHTPWAFLASVMKERMIANKVIKDIAELELNNLETRLSEERSKSDRTFISDLVFCAIARKIYTGNERHYT